MPVHGRSEVIRHIELLHLVVSKVFHKVDVDCIFVLAATTSCMVANHEKLLNKATTGSRLLKADLIDLWCIF